MNNEAEGGGKRSIVSDFGIILVTSRLVHLTINEALHRVNVEEGLYKVIVWIGESGLVQRLVHVHILYHGKYFLPHYDLHFY